MKYNYLILKNFFKIVSANPALSSPGLSAYILHHPPNPQPTPTPLPPPTISLFDVSHL